MLITLQAGTKELHRISSFQMNDVITVGRSTRCDWQVPGDENLVSSIHLHIEKKGRQILIVDQESSNGTYLLSKKIKKHRLNIGDKIKLGTCTISAREEPKSSIQHFEPQLLAQSGKIRGKVYKVAEAGMMIGSQASESDLAIMDPMISRKHSHIRVSNGASWLKDLGSRNGTAVNNEPLEAGQERLLKNDDLISIAHVEFVYSDGKEVRGPASIIKLLVVVLTLALAVGAKFAWDSYAVPPVDEYFVAVENLAAQADFDAAIDLLDQARTAKGFEQKKTKYLALSKQLRLWKSTQEQAVRVQELLKEKSWTEASRQLAALSSKEAEAWLWNPEAAQEKNQMDRAKVVLDAFLAGKALVQRPDVDTETLGNIKDTLADKVSNINGIPYLEPLAKESNELFTLIDIFASENVSIEQALEVLVGAQPNAYKARTSLEAMLPESSGLIRARLERLLPVVKKLEKALDGILSATQYTHQIQLDEAMGVEIILPSESEASIDLRLSTCRDNLENMYQNMGQHLIEFRFLYRDLNAQWDGQGVPRQLTILEDAQVLKNVLRCDCLDGPLPKFSRKEPMGAYDRVLGVENFYTYLMSFPDVNISPNSIATPFPTTLIEIQAIIEKIDRISLFMNNPQHAWMRSKQFKDYLVSLETFLQRRDQILGQLQARLQPAQGREALILAGIMYGIASKTQTLQHEGKPMPEWISKQVAASRKHVIALKLELRDSDFEQAASIRKRILDVGIPGDKQIHSIWILRAGENAFK
jgi:pSer/pThr/pTyr-binding forkhead associated (FHA) protein